VDGRPSDLTLGQVVIKRVAVVELRVNNGSGKIWRQMRSGRKK